MSADLMALLDQVDEAHVAWLAGSEGWSDRAIEAMEELPQLTAALRAVLDLADKWERGATRWENPLPIPTEVHAIRAAIAAALTPEQVQP